LEPARTHSSVSNGSSFGSAHRFVKTKAIRGKHSAWPVGLAVRRAVRLAVRHQTANLVLRRTHPLSSRISQTPSHLLKFPSRGEQLLRRASRLSGIISPWPSRKFQEAHCPWTLSIFQSRHRTRRDARVPCALWLSPLSYLPWSWSCCRACFWCSPTRSPSKRGRSPIASLGTS
jgi:hypothetical protein